MKKYLLVTKILVISFALTAIAFGAVTLQYFTAKSNSEGILVEWKTMEENNTVKFELERSAESPDNFIYVATISATGNNSFYSYQDNSVDLRSTDVYRYRLKCIDNSGSTSYTQSISVIHEVSGIRSTWGSIKAIFR
ncbi:MAG: hypothetical protein KDC73_08600 [Ignavibacteriae bacterium]|nr:hypothetical protein [Ignavibacteriota bacterium]MCB9242233.1 hypothetical protein [Ignavibacteriales bacterium]